METNTEEDIQIFREKLPITIIKQIALETFGEMAKAVIDIERKIIAVGGLVHADAEAVLIDDGSKQSDIWGINLYPDKPDEQFIEYHSLINVRPSVQNRSQEIQDPIVRQKISDTVHSMVVDGIRNDS